MKTVAIIYRANDLFEKWVDTIASITKKLGFKVEIKEFSQGTQYEDIKKWYMSSNLAEKIVLTDGTCSFPWEISKDIKKIIAKDFQYALDDFLEKSIMITVLGKSIQMLTKKTNDHIYLNESSLETLRTFLKIMISQMAKPKSVYIITKKLTDHDPFYSRRESASNEEELLMLELEAAHEIKDVLKNNGVVEIYILNDIQKEDMFVIDESENWIIVDRHFKGTDLEKRFQRFHNANLLSLPIGNFYKDALEQGLISADDKKLRKNLEKIIKGNFRGGD